MKKSLPLDAIDLASAPLFAITMLAEARGLRNRRLGEMGDLDDATREELSDPSLPPDPLVPVGYERHDTVASLTMLAGNVAVNLALAPVLGRINRFLFRHRVADIGKRRGSFLVATSPSVAMSRATRLRLTRCPARRSCPHTRGDP